MIQKISAWLGNPKRRYTDGLALFNALASDTQKKNFKEYFEKDSDKVTEQFDMKFTMLVNQVAFIQTRIKQNPEAYKQAIATSVADSDHIVDANKMVDAQPQSSKTDELPKELEPIMRRIKEIVPLMAKLHADMANEPADDKRIPIIEELVKLDDERRSAWAQIDNYDPSEEEKQIEAKTIAMGADIQKRIGQLKENIARNEVAIKKHTANKKLSYAEKAKKAVETYTDELAQLEMLVK